MPRWYKSIIYRGHYGAGKSLPAIVYFYVENLNELLERHKSMPGVKKNNHKFFPEASPLSEKESNELEKRILSENKISLQKAKRTWYYPLNEFAK